MLAHLKISSEMDIASRYTLFTLFTLFLLFKLLYIAFTQIHLYIWKGQLTCSAKCWMRGVGDTDTLQTVMTTRASAVLIDQQPTVSLLAKIIFFPNVIVIIINFAMEMRSWKFEWRKLSVLIPLILSDQLFTNPWTNIQGILFLFMSKSYH